MNDAIELKMQKMIQSHARYFILIGILPLKADEELDRLWRSSRLKSLLARCCPLAICLLCVIAQNTFFVAYNLRKLLQNEIEVEAVCELIIVQGVCLRYYMFVADRNATLQLFADLRRLAAFLRKGEVGLVKSFERIVFHFRVLFLFSYICVNVFYLLTACFVRLPPSQVNGTELRILPYRFYVDVQEQPWYILTTSLQMLIGFNLAITTTGLETILPFLIMMSCGYLKVVQNRFYAMKRRLTIGGGYAKRLNPNIVVDCVKLHQEVLRFSSRVSRYSGKFYLVQILSTIYNIAIIGILLLKIDSNNWKLTSILVSSALQFFACQYIPQHILQESESVADAAYEAALEHPIHDRAANQMLKLVIMRARKPVVIITGGYLRLSLETFKNMMISAFSFFTVLRNVFTK